MLSVILLILKIIGITILSILALLLLLLLLVLFVPIRYKLKFSRSGISGDPPALVVGKVTWLLHLINIRAMYPSDIYVRCRVFLFTVFRFPSKKEKNVKKEKNTKEKAKKDKKKDKKNKDAASDDKNEVCESGNTTNKDETFKKNEECESDASKNDIINDVEADSKGADTEEKLSISEKWERLKATIKNKIESVEETITHLEEKKDDITNKIEYYQNIIESKTFSDALSLCKKELLGILKSIGPRKVDVNLEVGMDDPSTTATILSYYGMFYAYLYNKVHLVGNFEEAVIRGNGIIKGKITIARLLLAGIRVYFNKNIKKLLRMLKKEEKKNGRK